MDISMTCPYQPLDISQLVSFITFLLRKKSMYPTQRISCSIEDIGVASPMRKSDASGWMLIIYETGTLTQKAPSIP